MLERCYGGLSLPLHLPASDAMNPGTTTPATTSVCAPSFGRNACHSKGAISAAYLNQMADCYAFCYFMFGFRCDTLPQKDKRRPSRRRRANGLHRSHATHAIRKRSYVMLNSTKGQINMPSDMLCKRFTVIHYRREADDDQADDDGRMGSIVPKLR